MMTLTEAFGKTIDQILKEKKLSKTGFAEMSHISRRHLQRIISGDTSPTLETLHIIATHLKVNPGKLILSAYQQL
ncbi:MAG: helix-turn-helix transcriptional regulator [Calditrichaeota bacterium]|nr:helix-turn-helix transcriptional regulator [Calditrichota bacterium]